MNEFSVKEYYDILLRQVPDDINNVLWRGVELSDGLIEPAACDRIEKEGPIGDVHHYNSAAGAVWKELLDRAGRIQPQLLVVMKHSTYINTLAMYVY